MTATTNRPGSRRGKETKIMEHTQDKTGTLARLTQDAKWTNYNTPTATLPAGSIVRIESWRPEGFNVIVEKSRDTRCN